LVSSCRCSPVLFFLLFFFFFFLIVHLATASVGVLESLTWSSSNRYIGIP
jgi:hypothetical protein